MKVVRENDVDEDVVAGGNKAGALNDDVAAEAVTNDVAVDVTAFMVASLVGVSSGL